MGGNGKHRWKISLHRFSSSPSRNLGKKDPPAEFVCPVSGSLMFDPVVVPTGQSFERTSVQVCRQLGFAPALPTGSKPDFSTVIPNLALKSMISKWCEKSGAERPKAPDYSSVVEVVQKMMAASGEDDGDSKIRANELTQENHFYSSSSEESVIANVPATPFLPFMTRPMCYSALSSTSTSSDIVSDENLGTDWSAEDEQFVVKLQSLDLFEQEQGAIELRKTTRTKEEQRISLCTPRLLSALRPALSSQYAAVQTNAVAALVNLSLEKSNKVRIVRAGILPPLIDVLKSGYSESQEHAAGAIFSLALEDDNKIPIGVLGALPPLVHALRLESKRTRLDSALALYHLTLVPNNRVKLVKLGAATALLALLRSGGLMGPLMLVLCNLAACAEGRSALLDAGAVKILVGLLKKDSGLESESTRENCVATLYSLSHGNFRFRGLAKAAQAEEVLREVAEGGNERASERAKQILWAMRGPAAAAAEEEVDWEAVMKEGASLYRARRTNSPEF
ncbi:U-box domain-containing protein 38-like [Diospyros lotus]|uniref:U-box domain-containing protein 38-like n=1 Tax=Diospyros lotus TaxID=55363 RepID=UPI002255D37A|nr:U-box domain-containing protein 38-like [Diospyros lotus]